MDRNDEVVNGVRRLSRGIVNFYLVEEGGSFVLIDAGAPKDWDFMTKAISSLGGGLDHLEAVLLTHAHADHVGFAERARADAHAAVWVHGADVEVASGGKPGKNDGSLSRYLFHAEFYRTVISLLGRGAARIVPVQEVSAFAHGETLDVPGRPSVVHVPGHTPGTAALFLEDRSSLLTGDALVTRNPLTGRVGPQIMPSGFNRDTEQAMRSLDALEGIRADAILPGHGEPWRDGVTDAIRRARAAGRS